MSKFLKRFETHSAYNTYINGQGRILPNVSYCRDNNDVHYNPVPKITIEFTLSEANEERIAIKGDLTSLQGFRDDVDGFENVTAIKIDGQEVSKTNDFTEKNVLNNYGIVIDGYFYDFTTSGTHTIEYELNSLTLPQGLLNLLGNYNYYGIVFSSKMTQISVSLNGINEIETNALTINSINEVIFDKNIKNITSFSDYIFSDCTSLTSVIMPNNVTSIGANAFQYCTSLTNITIPNSVTSIGSDAFSTCTSLTTVTLNSDAIVSQTYTHYSNFINIFGSQVSTYIFGKDVTSIGNYAFDGCTGLTNINIPNSVTSIGQSAFKSCSGITSITIPNSVTSIGSEAFSNCTGLTNVTMSDSVTSIGNYVFNQCSNLTSITIPNSVTTIGNYAFNNCSSLTSITIPSSVTSIGAHAFEYCTGLTSVTMSDGVTSIGSLQVSQYQIVSLLSVIMLSKIVQV